MKRNQLIVIAACVALFIAIYFFGVTKKPIDDTAGHTGQGHAQPQQAATEVLDIEAYISGIKAAADKTTQQTIEQAEKTQSYNALVAAYKKLDKPLAVAYYAVKQAEKSNQESELLGAGDYNSALLQSAPDDKSRRFLATNAIACYKKAVDIDTANTANRIRLAGAIMEEGSQPMQGVSMLLDVVKKDSNNIDAQLMLGRFGLISGQIDKAIVRFEKVLYLQPQNSEALYSLGEAYKDKGNTQKAIEQFEKCEKTLKDPAAKKEIEKVIERIKKPTS
jgi:tetratricopeptide (TPR) repeat protein